MTIDTPSPMQSFARGQLDRFLFENFFRGRREGVFVDVGAGDGRQQSNSLFFERSLGWSGLCVEPRSEYFAELLMQRRCVCERARIAPGPGAAEDSPSLGSTVPVRDLGALLAAHGICRVDYCSLDTGGNEARVLEGLDLERCHIDLFTVAHGGGQDTAAVLASRGYEFVAELGGARIFKRPDVARLPRTSVICAVWHADPDRECLLEGHAANLAAQSVGVDPIYVFDAADAPPAGVRGRHVVVHETLSIYQAWNVALSLVSTPFVLNLNLDDRLAPDAVERLEMALLREDAALAAGDWQVCYSQPETDAVQPSFPAEQLPYVHDWPPPPGTRTRLGTDARGTLGPATLWRMDAHVGAPRYPWRLADGTMLRVAGDIAWWQVLTGRLQKKIVRLPLVIGNYHSHPSAQAEFRGDRRELERMKTLGINLL